MKNGFFDEINDPAVIGAISTGVPVLVGFLYYVLNRFFPRTVKGVREVISGIANARKELTQMTNAAQMQATSLQATFNQNLEQATQRGGVSREQVRRVGMIDAVGQGKERMQKGTLQAQSDVKERLQSIAGQGAKLVQDARSVQRDAAGQGQKQLQSIAGQGAKLVQDARSVQRDAAGQGQKQLQSIAGQGAKLVQDARSVQRDAAGQGQKQLQSIAGQGAKLVQDARSVQRDAAGQGQKRLQSIAGQGAKLVQDAKRAGAAIQVTRSLE